MNWRKYFEIVRISFFEASTYRLHAIASFVGSLVFLALYYAVWSSIDASGTLEGGLNQVMTYLVIGQVVSGTVFMGTEKFIGERVRKGTIVNELKRPLGLLTHAYFHELGWASFNFIAKAIPLTVAGILFLNIQLPSAPNMIAFILSMFMAFNLVVMLAYTVSMAVFWTKVEWSLRMMRNTIQRLFSGVLFPLYLLPDSLKQFFSLLPFQAMADGPIRIFTMQATGWEVIRVFAIQSFWFVVLFIISRLVWRKAKTKLTVQGG